MTKTKWKTNSSFWFTCTLVVLFSATLLCLQPKSTVSALGNDTDQLSSLRFKEAVENNPFNVLASWNSSTHFCKWHGVTCSLNHQRVSALNLQGYALRGFITPEIGNLTLDASSTVKVCVCINVLSSIADVPRNQVWLQEFVWSPLNGVLMSNKTQQKLSVFFEEFLGAKGTFLAIPVADFYFG